MFDALIQNNKGLWLGVQRRVREGALELTFHLKGSGPCRLHWGTAARKGSMWQRPGESLWPEGSLPHGKTAVQTPFQPGAEADELVLRFPDPQVPPFLVFDLFLPETNRWENNEGRDFWVALAEPGPAPLRVLETHLAPLRTSEPVRTKVFDLEGQGELATAIVPQADRVELVLVTDVQAPLWLHWGLQDRARSPWNPPAPNHCPPGTSKYDERAVRTPFKAQQGLRWLTLTFPGAEAPSGVGFVLYQSESDRWLKSGGRDLHLRLSSTGSGAAALSELMARIVEAEMGEHGWTLMHRFNLCHDLIDEAADDRDAWATLFVWLRYSAIRQLDWQRNYNTKPRELSHAQDRLTARLAEAFIQHRAQGDLIRGMLAGVGRGGDGQRIRDDILQIMHRHHIKEVGGTWMEQWHQKLHNNTTPDDIVICEAFLAFLRGNGDLNAYEGTLLNGGVTRERLEALERPITQNPEWHPHLKDGLIHDLENYLGLLRSVHSGTDLQNAANSAAYLLEGGGRDALGFVQWNFQNSGVDAVELTARITEVRKALAGVLERESNPGRVKDGLYLDLALEDALRTAIERQLQGGFGNEPLLTLIDLVLSNLRLTHADPELNQCRREWRRLPAGDRFSPDWCLRAKAVVDRTRRAVEALTDRTYQLLQPKAELLGREFEAAKWTVSLFSEEIVRGRPVFVLSMLLHYLDPVLRKGASLGDWQVVSPSHTTGTVVVVDELRSLQGKRFAEPTVVIADLVHGDEEPPEGVQAVLTSRSVDLVSHVAVRARNANLLFATCFDDATFQQLKSWAGKTVQLRVTPAGDVEVSEQSAAATQIAPTRRKASAKVALPKPSLRVLLRSEFDPKLVGGKSWRLRRMGETMPEAFRTPRSVALPFRVFDAVLAHPANRDAARQVQSLVSGLGNPAETKLAVVRDCIRGLELPTELLEMLAAAMKHEGFGPLADPAKAGSRIKEVWASLWNDRAYYSREANGLPHESVSMAVLIQEVVEAEYAFVIHTINPATQNSGEIYAEVVCGLGETLVGNHPGRALSVSVQKQTLEARILAYPAKSLGLFGGGLIFRSDSNAEDLEGYAGAGLYDSVLLTPPVERRLDYTQERLVWDESFQANLVQGIARLAIEVEKAFDGPQDIEGAWVDDVFHVVQTRPQVGI